MLQDNIGSICFIHVLMLTLRSQFSSVYNTYKIIEVILELSINRNLTPTLFPRSHKILGVFQL
jgi:hypothetical protein